MVRFFRCSVLRFLFGPLGALLPSPCAATGLLGLIRCFSFCSVFPHSARRSSSSLEPDCDRLGKSFSPLASNSFLYNSQHRSISQAFLFIRFGKILGSSFFLFLFNEIITMHGDPCISLHSFSKFSKNCHTRNPTYFTKDYRNNSDMYENAM